MSGKRRSDRPDLGIKGGTGLKGRQCQEAGGQRRITDEHVGQVKGKGTYEKSASRLC